MTAKPALPREQAHQDIIAAIDFYRRETDEGVASSFVDAVQDAIASIIRNPAGGSPRYGEELRLPGVRHWRLKRFPHLIFYVDRDGHIDIWRMLHARRDIPESMQGPF